MRESVYSYYGNKAHNADRRSRRGYYDGYTNMEDGLVIEDNTIYEIDLDCYQCLQEQKKKLF